MGDIVFIVLSVIALICFFLWVAFQNAVDKEVEKHKETLDLEYKMKSSKYASVQKLESEIEKKYREQYSVELQKAETQLKNELLNKYTQEERELQNKYDYLLRIQHNDLEKLLQSHQVAFPYLAGLITNYLTIDLERANKKLSESMSMRIADKAVKVTTLTKQLKETTYQYYLLKYQMDYLFALYPKLQYIIDSDISDLPSYRSEDDSDPVKNFLSESEYFSLSENERNQRALDTYIASHKKTSWQIGRDYELYVGYRMRSNQFIVEQSGVSDKFEDLGRDIIATKNDIHYIVQCKYWSSDKIIREKHIAQLYGTSVCYALEHNLPREKVRAVFYTNIGFSDMAKQFAEALSVKLIDHFTLGDFPRIKCKVNCDEYGCKTYIYHLPMDQQYDSAKINLSKGDMYAFTVEEAVSHGFRRAYRWHGN